MTQEQKDKIARIEEMLAKLKAEMEDSKPDELTRDTGKPAPNQQGHFWINSKGDGEYSILNKFTNEYDAYNSFETEEEADREATYTLASRRVRAFAKAVNGEWKADWGNEEQSKWGIHYDYGKLCLDSYNSYNGFIHQIVFSTEELAAKALELFKDEWQILANP